MTNRNSQTQSHHETANILMNNLLNRTTIPKELGKHLDLINHTPPETCGDDNIIKMRDLVESKLVKSSAAKIDIAYAKAHEDAGRHRTLGRATEYTAPTIHRVVTGIPESIEINMTYVRRACYNCPELYEDFELYVTTSLPITDLESENVRLAIMKTLRYYGHKFTDREFVDFMNVYESVGTGYYADC